VASSSTNPRTKSVTERKVRRPTLGGLAELVVDAQDGYEMLTLPASLIDGAPAALRPVLAKAQVRQRRLADEELFAAGLLGGCAAELAKTLVLHPLDTAKTRVQAQRLNGTMDWSGAQLFNRPWAGVGPALATAVPQAGFFFATRDVVRREVGTLVATSKLDSTLAALAAVTAASCAYWVVRAPSEVVKLRQQAGKQQIERAASTTAAIPVVESSYAPTDYLRLCAAAFVPCVVADLPSIYARVLSYQAIKGGWLSGATSSMALPPLVIDEILAVGIACTVALLATPIDVVRTRTLQRILSTYEASKDLAEYDVDGSNDLDQRELQALLAAKGLSIDDAQADELMRRYDADESLRLDAEELRRLGKQNPACANRDAKAHRTDTRCIHASQRLLNSAGSRQPPCLTCAAW
jgi:hypothetical protein